MKMGNFLTTMLARLLPKEESKDHEIHHNIVVCCGSLSVTDNKSDSEESDDYQDSLCR